MEKISVPKTLNPFLDGYQLPAPDEDTTIPSVNGTASLFDTPVPKASSANHQTAAAAQNSNPFIPFDAIDTEATNLTENNSNASENQVTNNNNNNIINNHNINAKVRDEQERIESEVSRSYFFFSFLENQK